MSALPTFQLYPERLSQDNNDCLLLLSTPVSEEDIRVSLQIMGEPAMSIDIRAKDPRTYVITVPDEHLQNEVIMVYIQYKSTMIGCGRISVEKPCEQLARLLEKALDPVQLMMSALGLKTGSETDLKTLDRDLANVVARNVPPSHLNILFKDYNNAKPTSGDISASSRFPTALHFSAHYGFTRLTDTLLCCQGSKAALMVVNNEGNTPREMAINSGHQQIVRTFEKKATEHDEEYATVSDLLDSKTDDSDCGGTYLDMGQIKQQDSKSKLWSVKSKTGPSLPNTPPPPRPRTNSMSKLQVIKEVDPAPELRDSGVFDGNRDSSASAGSRISGESLSEAYDGDIIDAPALAKGGKLKRSPPVTTIRRNDVVSDPHDGNPPSMGHRRIKRPSLPNIHMTSSPPFPSEPEDGPPPCQGAIYQNQEQVSVERSPVPRKMSLPGTSLDITELHKNQIFMKRKNVISP